MLPSPCHERDRWRTPVKARSRCRRPLLELPRGEGGAPSPVREWRPFASVIAATPRALNPMSHQPRRTRASREEESARLPEGRLWLGIPRALALSRERCDERLGSLRPLESKPSKDSRILRRRCPRTAPLPISAFWRGGVAVRERAALLVAGWVAIRMRKHSNRHSPFAHQAHPALSRANGFLRETPREERVPRESSR